MRTRLRRRNRLKRLFPGLFLAAALPVTAWLLFKAVPGLSGYAVKAGIVSAGLLLPEGGLALLQGEKEVPEEPASSVPEPIVTVSLPEESEEPIEPPSSEAESSALPAEPEPDPEIPEEYQATLLHKTYTAPSSSIYIPLKNGYVKNCTSVSREEILKRASELPAFSLSDTDEPQVLIMHTHTTESYMPFRGDLYDTRTSFRTTDNRQNMVAVGNRIEEELKAAGIGVLHDVTQHDYPSYNGSYQRSRKTVEQYLAEYPSIRVVLDIHRDAIVSGDTVTAPSAEIEGKSAAQIMIISGCDDGTMDYPNYGENLQFSIALQEQLEGMYPGLTRPILFDYRLYNQDLTTGSILIEVGGHGNTLEEACYSGELIGKGLSELLEGLKK